MNLPGQVLSQNSGNISEHAILAASLILGYSSEYEKARKEYNKKQGKKIDEDLDVPLADRLFICLGLNSRSKPVMWVMIFSECMSGVEFWDIERKKVYKLPYRVSKEERPTLARYLKTRRNSNSLKPRGFFRGKATSERGGASSCSSKGNTASIFRNKEKKRRIRKKDAKFR